MTVIFQERKNIAPRTNTTLRPFETTPDNVEVNACWAPITSELIREISAPV